jgi:hypothetical protein
MSNVALTREEMDALKRLNDSSPTAMIAQDIIDSLIRKGVLFNRSASHIDLTPMGEDLYDDLFGDEEEDDG